MNAELTLRVTLRALRRDALGACEARVGVTGRIRASRRGDEESEARQTPCERCGVHGDLGAVEPARRVMRPRSDVDSDRRMLALLHEHRGLTATALPGLRSHRRWRWCCR